MRLVIALGGNAILRKGESGFPEEEWRNIIKTAQLIASSIGPHDEVVITHGNGPQVGYLLEVMQMSSSTHPVQSMDLADAMTQGWLGFMLQNAIDNALKGSRRVIAVITRTLVDEHDPSFSNPTKFVGSYFNEDEASKLSSKYGWTFRRDPRGGLRRVVPSPDPIDVLEAPIIEKLIGEGYIVVAVGGGGIPVVKTEGGLRPVEAVVDKDLASSLLAVKIRADRLVIATDVKGVAIDFGKPTQRWLESVKVDELENLYRAGMFPPGSMGPKVDAAIRFVKATSRQAVIGSLEDLPLLIRGEAGTVVMP